MLCFYGFSGVRTAPEFYYFDIEIKDNHAILPSLQTDRFWRDGLERDEDVIFHGCLFMMEGRREIVFFAVVERVVSLLYSVGM